MRGAEGTAANDLVKPAQEVVHDNNFVYIDVHLVSIQACTDHKEQYHIISPGNVGMFGVICKSHC